MNKLLTILVIICLGANLQAQSDLAFYHLGAKTPQSSMNNASFFPDAEFYFSFPGMSGVNVGLNNGLTYNHLFVPVAGTDSVQIDLENALNQLSEGDNLSLRGDVSLFQFGVRAGKKTFSLFYNLRYSGGLAYPVNFLNYFVYGNGNRIGEVIEENSINGGGIAYTEIGLGYSQEFLVGERKLRVGARLKKLSGIAQVSAAPDASMTMFTNPVNYDIEVQFNNALFRTAGLNEVQGDSPAGYILGFGSNQNNGFAFDIGGEFEVNEKLTTFLSINDVGSINWKQDIENYRLTDSQIVLTGFDNLDDIDVSQALEDSLDAWTQTETITSGSYKTPIGARYIVGASYQVLEKGRFTGTFMRNGSSIGSSMIGFGLGYTHQFGKIFAISTTASKEQYQPVNVGGGFELRLGLLQIYGAFDDVLGALGDVANTNSLTARFGINFLVGRSNTGKNANKEKKVKEELSPFPPEYDLDHLNDKQEDQEDSRR